MITGIKTNPDKNPKGTVLVFVKKGEVQEVISDLQLDVQIIEMDKGDGGLYKGIPSRPLWEYVRKTTCKLLEDVE